MTLPGTIFRQSIMRLSSIPSLKIVPMIGLEIHAQLTSARSKLFSSTLYEFSASPNTRINAFDASLPGTMPIISPSCVEWAVVSALGLSCHINLESRFDRKHYFYSDSPAGYQITQHDQPVAENGYFEYIWRPHQTKSSTRISGAKIKRIQLEQDTGKSLHDDKTNRSLIDLNRAGVGLIEIVTDPDFESSIQAVAFVEELASVLRHLRVCSANMSAGEMRVDVNVSVGPSVSNQGPVVEVKNVNSLRSIRQAIDYEISRQCDIVQSGGAVINETRSYDVNSNKTVPLRDKEVVQDYRFLPEPNLPALRLLEVCEHCEGNNASGFGQKSVCVECIKRKYASVLSELPVRIRQQMIFEHGLPLERAAVIIEEPKLRTLYFSASSLAISSLPQFEREITEVQNVSENDLEKLVYREVSYWCSGLLFSGARERVNFSLPSPEQLSKFVIMNLTGQIFGIGSEKVLDELSSSDASIDALDIANRLGVILFHDHVAIKRICTEFVDSNHDLVNKYIRKGRKRRNLQSMVNRVISNHVDIKLHEGLVERCIVEILKQYNFQN